MFSSNAIGWAHFVLRGGTRNLAITTAAYAMILLSTFFLTLRIDPTAIAQACQAWTFGLLALQIGLLVLLGCTSVRGAIRRDINSRIMESHRLMPVTGTAALLGYLTGPTTQALSLAGVNLLLGGLTASMGGLSVRDWLAVNALLLVFAACAWSAVALYAFLLKAGLISLVVLILVLSIGQGYLLSLVPAAILPISPIIGDSFFGLLFGPGSFGWPYAVSIAAQAVAATICLVAARRKYLREDVTAVGPFLGLLLVAWWVGVSVVAIMFWGSFSPRWLDPHWIGRHTQLISSLAVSMLLAIVPISAAVWAEERRACRRELGDREKRPRPASAILVALVSALVCLMLLAAVIPFGASVRAAADPLFRTGLMMSITLLSFAYLLRIVYRLKPGMERLSLGVWIVVTWLGPVLVEQAQLAVVAEEQWHELAPIGAISPVGALNYLWNYHRMDINLGLGLQAGLLVVLVLADRLVRQLPRGLEPVSVPGTASGAASSC